MANSLPQDIVVILHNKLDRLSKRDPKRKLVIQETADLYGVSVSTVYRSINKYNKLSTVTRADYNSPRLMSFDSIKRYCEIIAALKLRTSNKKGRHLSTAACIKILEEVGVEINNELVKAPSGLLKKSTVSFYLRRFNLQYSSLHIQPCFTRFQAKHSNECWQFDFSRSDLQYLGNSKKKLMILGVVDDRSGVKYQEYHECDGEDVIVALHFLYRAMAAKNGNAFQGIPKNLYIDNGPISKSKIFKQVMANLDITILTHMPEGQDGRRKTARSKGKVERSFKSTKESFEPLYHLQPPQTLDEANIWLTNYVLDYNQSKHRTESHSKLEDWQQNLPDAGYRAMCEWEHFTKLVREPETRKVENDACVNVDGIKYQLSPEFAGQTVTLLWGLLDNELFISYNDKHHGPFYPMSAPIPFGSYRKFKKSSQEKKVDKIEHLSKIISISKTTLESSDSYTKELINKANLSKYPERFIPFEKSSPFENNMYKDAIEAKSAISNWLGYPLSRLDSKLIKQINNIVQENLNKKLVMSKVKQLFETKIEVT